MDEREYQELITPYRECMENMENRIRVLAEDYRDRCGEEPIHHIQKRIKTKESIEGKLRRRDMEETAEDARNYLRDIAGIRVICYDLEGIRKLTRALKRQMDLEIVKEKDYIANPKPNGYRSLHVIVRIPVYFLDKKELIPVEVQLRTVAMDFWASLEHDLKYKAVRDLEGIDTRAELKDCSRIIEDVEARMQILARALEVGE